MLVGVFIIGLYVTKYIEPLVLRSNQQSDLWNREPTNRSLPGPVLIAIYMFMNVVRAHCR
uniref:Uncharacterized protein n=1 Tax=Arundo donax TaxID=35708 RepID=A0A0A9AT44_ARUDO